MHFLISIYCCFTVCTATTFALNTSDIVVIILSQSNQYNLQVAEALRRNIYKQAEVLSKEYPVVYVSSINFTHVGDWTVLPIIPYLTSVHQSNKSWYLFIEDNTHINLEEIRITLNKYNHNKELWLGHGLYDETATIIHHFAFYEDPTSFLYPCIPCGFAISNKLIQTLTHRLKDAEDLQADFSIDSAHEVALFIWNGGSGQSLQNDSAFCIEKGTQCATYPLPPPSCGEVDPESIYFAVKTCKKFHMDRIPIIKKSWGVYARNLNFFSDSTDEHIPTIDVGIPNVEKGHCSKTLAIIKHIAKVIKDQPHIKWSVIVDDDTILSVLRLRKLLACHNASLPMALGERYGFGVHTHHGYNYITGGGGIVLSRELLEELARNELCQCPALNSPDDMYIGMCISSIGFNVTHSSQFHQARPLDYPSELLEAIPPISFHKHWMVDPMDVYNRWFAEADSGVESSQRKHEEL